MGILYRHVFLEIWRELEPLHMRTLRARLSQHMLGQSHISYQSMKPAMHNHVLQEARTKEAATWESSKPIFKTPNALVKDMACWKGSRQWWHRNTCTYTWFELRLIQHPNKPGLRTGVSFLLLFSSWWLVMVTMHFPFCWEVTVQAFYHTVSRWGMWQLVHLRESEPEPFQGAWICRHKKVRFESQ